MNGKWCLFTIVLLSVSLFSLAQERVVERPEFRARSSETIEIDKIVINDTATILYIDAFYRPKNWIIINAGTYINAGGQKLKVIGSDGIKLNDYFWMPESGTASFKLFFPPIDPSVDRIDFMETDCDDCFKIWGIALNPELTIPAVNLPEEIKKVLSVKYEKSLAPELKIGRTKVHVHFFDCPDGLKKGKMLIYLYEFLTGKQREYTAVKNTDGSYLFEFDQYGMAPAFIVYNNQTTGGRIFLSPGEEMTIYLDLEAMSRLGARYGVKTAPRPLSYATGKYSVLNNCDRFQNFDVFPEEFPYNMEGKTLDEYVDYVVRHYKLAMEKIRKDKSYTDATREYMEITCKNVLLSQLMSAVSLFEAFYRQKNNISWDQRITDFKSPEYKLEHLAILKEAGINDLKSLYSSDFSSFVGGLFYIVKTKENLQKLFGTDKGVLFDLWNVQGIIKRIENLEPLTEEQQQNLASISNPFYKEAFEDMQKRLNEKINSISMKEDVRICDIPQVENDKLFDAIVERYKGKVVLVDYWATWCGPCRSAIEMMEPLKNKDLIGKDIVHVYLTGLSSPEGVWLQMIPAIKGEHYRLSTEQWDAVCNKFNIEGIPAYVLVNKQGEYSLRDDFRDINTIKRILINESSK